MLQFSPPKPLTERFASRDALTARVWRELALQDWIALVYLGALLTFCLAGDGPRRATAIGYLLIDIAVLALGLFLSRSKILSGVAGAIAYRVGLFTAVFGSFAHLQYILPTARSVRLDAELYALDKAVFGFEPAEVFDRFVTTASVEWFSFFYFGYFFILAVHIFPFMFVVKNVKLLAELSFGIIALFCVGHLMYLVVPGYGPYQHLAGHFSHELAGPTWWRLVKATVDAGEVTARTDIFPSLHTAAPTFIALFSFRHRRVGLFRYTWLPMALFASQIVVSTMFLRWHYLIDVIAGLALATGLSLLSAHVARWESARRDALGRSPVWTAPWGAGVTPDAAIPRPLPLRRDAPIVSALHPLNATDLTARGELQRRRDRVFTLRRGASNPTTVGVLALGRVIAVASGHARIDHEGPRASHPPRVRVGRARLPREGGSGPGRGRA